MRHLSTLAIPLLALLVSAPAPAQRCSDLRLNTDAPGAAPSNRPQIATLGSAVFVTWYDSRNGNPDIYFNRSLDGGATWLATDVRLDTDAPGAAISAQPRIAASGSAVYVVWYDHRNGLEDIYFNRSLDGGATWLAADVGIGTDVPGAASSWSPEIAASGSTVYVTWSDGRNGSTDIFFNRSSDGGGTWLATDVRIGSDVPGAASSNFVKMAASGPAVFVTWSDGRNGSSDVYFNRSLDGGTTWLVADVRLNTAVPSRQTREVAIAVSGSLVYVTWTDYRNGFTDIYLNRSLDDGTTWLAADVRLDTDVAGATESKYPQIAAAGGSVYVTWADGRSGGNWDIHFNRSLDVGNTWLPADVRLDTDPPGASLSNFPQILASGSTVSVVWEDRRQPGSFDIRLNQSLDAGATWLAEDVRLDTADGYSGRAQIATGSGSLYVTWQDARDIGHDIYFRSTPDQVSPASEIVRLGIIPNPNALRPGQTSGPVIGCTWDPVIDHATFLPGASTDFLCLGTSMDVSIPPFGSLLCTLQVCVPSAAGSPFAIPVPNNSTLLGAGLSVQGVSVEGLTAKLTNALDVVFGNF